MNRNNFIATRIKEHLSEGWNKNQSKSLAWADYFDEWCHKYEMDHDGAFCNLRIDCHCKDCNEGAHLIPSGVYDFMANHMNHRTTTFKR